jgi:hypothetical protein
MGANSDAQAHKFLEESAPDAAVARKAPDALLGIIQEAPHLPVVPRMLEAPLGIETGDMVATLNM